MPAIQNLIETVREVFTLPRCKPAGHGLRVVDLHGVPLSDVQPTIRQAWASAAEFARAMKRERRILLT